MLVQHTKTADVTNLSFVCALLIGACGRAGESAKALSLFQSMKEDGLSADRVAYNTLFSALRVAGDADNVSGKYCKLGESLTG